MGDIGSSTTSRTEQGIQGSNKSEKALHPGCDLALIGHGAALAH